MLRRRSSGPVAVGEIRPLAFMIFTPEVVGPGSNSAALRKTISELVLKWRRGRRALGGSPRFPRGPVGRAGVGVLVARARRKITEGS